MNLVRIGIVITLLSGCTQGIRTRRLLGPDHYVTPRTPTGEHALVVAATGWDDETPRTYRPPSQFERAGVVWIRPMVLTDRGWIQVRALHPDSTLRLYLRPTGLERGGFRPLTARSGTLGGELDTALRFFDAGPLGSEPRRINIADLQSPYAGDRLSHGDLLLVEVGPPGSEPERYLFRARDFGWRTRLGASLMIRAPLRSTEELPSPALMVNVALGYRFRTRQPVLEFLGERMTLVAGVGVGSAALESVSGPLDEQLQGAFNALLVGGGIEMFEFLSVQAIVNPRAPFRRDIRTEWTLGAGFDAVQFSRFFADAGARLFRDSPLREDR